MPRTPCISLYQPRPGARGGPGPRRARRPARKAATLCLAGALAAAAWAAPLRAAEAVTVYDPLFGLPAEPRPGEWDLWVLAQADDDLFGSRATRVLSNALFMRTHPGVRVVEGRFDVWDPQATIQGLSQGEPYPWYRPFGGLAQARADGLLADITDIVAELGLLERIPASHWPGAWSEGRLYLLSFMGRLVTNPLAYRRDLFRAAGLAEPGPGFTWHDFREAARRLTWDRTGDGRIDQWGYAAFGTHGLAEMAYAFGAPPGLLVPDPAGRSTWRSALTDPGVLQALALIQQMTVGDRSALAAPGLSYGDVYQAFRAGRAAMVFQVNSDHHVLYQGGLRGLFGPPQAPATDYVGLAPLPVGPQGLAYPTLTLSGFGFNPRLSPAELRAAVEKAVWDWYGYGHGLANLDRYLRTGIPYRYPFVQAPEPNLGYPARAEVIPAAYWQSERARRQVPAPPDPAAFGLANPYSFEPDLVALIDRILEEPGLDVAAAAREAAAAIDEAVLDYRLPGAGPQSLRLYYEALDDFYRQHYPAYHQGRFQGLWEEASRLW